MDNYSIADQFSLLAKLMDIHGENSFKAKSYSAAAFAIEKLPVQLSETSADKFASFKGIGDSAAKKIIELLNTGKLSALDEIIAKTPAGIIEMLNIKGIGPKKISTIWKEMEIESIGELLYACNENRLLLYKGFGEKTQNNIRESLEFYLKNQGSYLYAEIIAYATAIAGQLQTGFANEQVSLTGAIRRQLEIINEIELVTTAAPPAISQFFTNNNFTATGAKENTLEFKGPENITIIIHCCTGAAYASGLFTTSAGTAFLDHCKNNAKWSAAATATSETGIFNGLGIIELPPYLREQPWQAALKEVPAIIQPDDIKGIIHSHSNWSDGAVSIEEMAQACIKDGYEYLVISDHSKSAFYANGLQEERIREQHIHIDELNKKLAPFKIFKSIEADILNDGALDYSDNILSTFDLVIASVHSNLKMPEEKAMARLLAAIENKYTTILGHMTGRLLLSRKGYPVNHSKIIDACAANNVVIELNAHPRRLDIDWRFIHEAVEKGVLISIDPDAHSTEGYKDCLYGVLAAQKAGLTAAQNLSSFSLQQFENFLTTYKKG